MRGSKVLLLSAAMLAVSAASALAAKNPPPPPRVPSPLVSNFTAGVTAYSSQSDYAGATSNLVTDTFEGVATGTNGQDYKSFASNVSGGLGTYIDANGTTFSSANSGYIGNLTIEGSQYGTNANGSYGAVGNDFGSDVLSTNYNALTITFAAPVTAFSVDYGSLGRAFTATTSPDLFTFTINGLGTATEGADGLTNFGSFEQASTGFFGVTSTTPFTSVTIDGLESGGFGVNNRFFDNVTFVAAPVVAAAPEPEAWALMLLGIGGAGLMLRRNRKVKTAGSELTSAV